MNRKQKGTAAERELIHLLWSAGYAAIRVAGSGCSRYPSCDIVASNGKQTFAFECKAIGDDARYIPKQEVADFLSFASRFGAEPWFAIRFSRTEWHFMLPEDMIDTPSSKGISRSVAQLKGILLDELIQRQLPLLQNSQ